MRRLLAAVFAVLTATSFGLLVATPSSGDTLGASVTRVGWWSQNPTAQKQPDGGFQVELNATGPQSVAAVEVTIGQAQSVTSTTLTLTESQSVASPNGAALKACSVLVAGWKADNPGAWSDQPANDCGRSVTLERDAGSSTWKGDISPLVQAGGASSVMIVPVANPVAGLADPGFQVTIGKVEVAADGTTSSSSSDSSFSSFSSDSSSPGSSGSSSTATGSSGSSGFSSAAPSSNASVAFAPSSPDSATAAPLSPAPPAVASPSAPSAPAAPSNVTPPPPISAGNGSVAVAKGRGQSKPWGRLVLFIPLSVAIGYGATEAKRRNLLPA